MAKRTNRSAGQAKGEPVPHRFLFRGGDESSATIANAAQKSRHQIARPILLVVVLVLVLDSLQFDYEDDEEDEDEKLARPVTSALGAISQSLAP